MFFNQGFINFNLKLDELSSLCEKKFPEFKFNISDSSSISILNKSNSEVKRIELISDFDRKTLKISFFNNSSIDFDFDKTLELNKLISKIFYDFYFIKLDFSEDQSFDHNNESFFELNDLVKNDNNLISYQNYDSFFLLNNLNGKELYEILISNDFSFDKNLSEIYFSNKHKKIINTFNFDLEVDFNFNNEKGQILIFCNDENDFETFYHSKQKYNLFSVIKNKKELDLFFVELYKLSNELMIKNEFAKEKAISDFGKNRVSKHFTLNVNDKGLVYSYNSYSYFLSNSLNRFSNNFNNIENLLSNEFYILNLIKDFTNHIFEILNDKKIKVLNDFNESFDNCIYNGSIDFSLEENIKFYINFNELNKNTLNNLKGNENIFDLFKIRIFINNEFHSKIFRYEDFSENIISDILTLRNKTRLSTLLKPIK